MQRLLTGPAMMIAVVFILILNLVGCGGGTTGLDADGAGGFGLIAPSEVPRPTSVTMPARTRVGVDHASTLEHNTTAVGPGLAFSPTWDAGHRSSDDISFAIYMFPLGDYSGSTEVILNWDSEPAAGTAWVGLGNHPDDSWDWSAYSSDAGLDYTPAIHQDGFGTLLVAVVMLDEMDRRLDTLRIGLDEPPVADLATDYITGRAPLTITLSGTGSTDAEGALTKYEFDPLGDGNWIDGGTTPEYPYEYTTPGVYYPALRVTDTSNTIAVADAEVYVGWQHSWGGSSYDDGMCVVRDGLENNYVLGLTTNFGQGANEHFIVKYDDQGDAIWQRTFGRVNGDDVNGMAYGWDGNLYVAGSAYDGSYFDPFVYSIATDGTLRWQKVWNTTGDSEAAGVACGGTGRVYLAVNYSPPFPDDDDVLLLCFDATDGTQLWGKVWSGSQNDRVVAITNDNLGNAWLLCQTRSFSLLNAITNTVLVEFDPDGNILYQAAYAIDTETEASAISWDDADSLLYFASMDTVVQLGSSHAINWQTQLTAPGEMAILGIVPLAGGGCYLSGGYYSGTILEGLLMRLDATGGLDYRKAFALDSVHQLFDGMEVLGDLSLVIAGRTENNDGTWTDVSVSDASLAHTMTAVSGTVTDTAVTSVNHDGVLADLPIGTETLDTGGGDADMSIQRFYPLEPGNW